MPLEKPGSALVVSLLKFLSVESASLSGGVAGGSLSSNHICGVAGSVGKRRQEEKGKPANFHFKIRVVESGACLFVE